ncbi:14538_t:CDS:2, partial [Racocetra fulgida]
LHEIHEKGFVHRDFHPGNVLIDSNSEKLYITDLGLCRPANEKSKEKKIYGVLPYVAPEVLMDYMENSNADEGFEELHGVYLSLLMQEGFFDKPFPVKIHPGAVYT